MPWVAYPEELTPHHWDIRKPLAARSRPTGIGAALAALQRAHNSVAFSDYEPAAEIDHIEGKLAEWPTLFARNLKPISHIARDVHQLAQQRAADFQREKLIPQAAAAACGAVADSARAYADAILDLEDAHARELIARRTICTSDARQTLQPQWTLTAAKIDELLLDIADFAGNANRETYWNIFQRAGNARAYTIACAQWDQSLSEFPELRDQCRPGNALEDFFPGMADYGAEYTLKEFEARVNPKTGKSGDACYKWHAVKMLKETPRIRRFKAAIERLLTLLG